MTASVDTIEEIRKRFEKVLSGGGADCIRVFRESCG